MLRIARGSLAVVGITVAIAGRAEAGGTLATDFLLAAGDEYVRCVVSNVSTKEVVVDAIEAFDSSGALLNRFGPFTLPPGKSEQNTFVFSSTRLVLHTKKPKAVRAYACVSKQGSSLCLTESQAR